MDKAKELQVKKSPRLIPLRVTSTAWGFVEELCRKVDALAEPCLKPLA